MTPAPRALYARGHGLRPRPRRHRLRARGRKGRGAGGLLRQARRVVEREARAGRRRRAHGHAPDQDAARDRDLPLGLPPARALWPERRPEPRPGRAQAPVAQGRRARPRGRPHELEPRASRGAPGPRASRASSTLTPSSAAARRRRAAAHDERGVPRRDRLEAATTPPNIPFDDPDVDDSDTILQIDRLPKTMLVVGGGVIGCEYASMFAAMRVAGHARRGRDRACCPSSTRRSASACAARCSRSAWSSPGGDHEEHPPRRGTRHRDARSTTAQEIAAEKVLASSGRGGRTDGLGLAELGVAVDKRGSSTSTRTTAPPCPASTPRATSSASRRSPRPRWSRRASRSATPSASPTSGRSRTSCRSASTRSPR